MSNDEPELIARILDGSHEEFRTLVDRYKQQLYRHCFFIMHDEDAAELTDREPEKNRLLYEQECGFFVRAHPGEP